VFNFKSVCSLEHRDLNLKACYEDERNKFRIIDRQQYIRREQDGECRKCIRAWRTYPPRYARERGGRGL